MAKGKNLNPADAYRKAQRKKELKKNKAERAKARDFALVKKDTRDLEDEIEKLEGLEHPSAADKSRLATVKSELENIIKKKEEYVKEHPEQRKLVFRPRDKNESNKTTEEIILPKKRNYFDRNGLPRHPERSIYYDPVMNPYGVAPPGMPYMERPLRPDEVDSEVEDDSDEDDITMPEGPPPGIDEAIGSDDEIPMPDGPPPGAEIVKGNEDDGETPLPDTSQPPLLPTTGLPSQPPPLPNTTSPPLPPGFPPLPAGTPPVPPTFPMGNLPPAPMNFPPTNLPPPPMGFPGTVPPFPPPPPPPPAGFIPSVAPFNSMPVPPPGFFPRRNQSTSAMQDPLSSIPHQTYQAHRASRLVAHPSLPAKPETASPSSAATTAAATVSAAPQLRDLKKEATAFVPSALKRKKASAASASSSRVNAAPGVGTDADESAIPAAARPDLLGTLRNQFGTAPLTSGNESDVTGKVKKQEVKKKDDYKKFVEEIGDILNPP